jgi:hypothetical protein
MVNTILEILFFKFLNHRNLIEGKLKWAAVDDASLIWGGIFFIL